MDGSRFHSEGGNSRRISRRRWLEALGVGGAAALAGCSGGGNETATSTDSSTPRDELPEVGGTYSRTVSSPIQTLNPIYNTENGAGDLISYALDYTYAFAPGTEVLPQTAGEFTTDDSQVWVYSLRDNLQFSDPYGQVTAEDYTYLINEIHKSDWAASANTDAWGSDVNVERTGELEFQIELPSADPFYPETYDPLLYAIPKDLVQPYVEEQDTEGMRQDTELNELQFTGNLGAYTLDTWERGNKLVFSRNEDYYLSGAEDMPELFGNAPYFETIESEVVQEQSSRLAQLKTGETDVAAVPPARYDEFNNLNDVTVYKQPQPYNVVNSYNMRDNGWNAGPGNLFRSRTFRQGLACAVDKERLVRGVYRGLATPEFTWQPEWSKWYPDDTSQIRAFGVGDLYGKEATQSRIKEAIDASEYDYSYDGDRLVNPSGDGVTLEIYHSAGQNTEKQATEFIAQEFSTNAGIEVNVNAIQGSEFATQYWQQEEPENPDEYEWSNGSYNAGPREVTSQNGWDMSMVYGLNTYPLNPLTNEVFFTIEESFYNPYGYVPEWNAPELFQQASETTSEEELQSIFSEIFVEISEAQPLGMLALSTDTPGYSSDIAGPEENFFSGWNFPGWYRQE
jgi:peptide/nickel transport system substrate-binding protein